ncbi:type I-E CRISPR-associated protein Cse2/CasB [Xenorhabdus griffiniae]|uniref:type I-E CRISPR-associated protein Cse2/CasB n=1 Tax=Xenorhabdus griffiniae TaxID=351672 RepID=UPI00235A3CF0|nr:type I-E CRISPR-associated protein Cse2/CasB [Xenorhabdus griffiniae]MDC9604752.1 type I-E CRISPR-associated protein Cse2/CasB [Xenorhabdus griffiniae]
MSDSDPNFDAMALYKAWKKMNNGDIAQLRRVTEPRELKNIPAFYYLVRDFGWHAPKNQLPLLRMVFCLSAGKDVITHIESEDDKNKKVITLGKALANSGRISERRLYQMLRADWPNDMVQLRRLLIHAEPKLDWPTLAEQLTRWNRHDRSRILEDFILALPQKKKA